MSDYIDSLNEEYESMFYKGEDLNLELDPSVEAAISQNPIIQDLFYSAVAEGDTKFAEYWGRLACETNGVELEYLSNGTNIDELENFNPAESNDLFNSSEAMEIWECQGDTLRCAQYSQLFIIEEMYGIKIDPDEFCAVSEANGWFDEANGTSAENMNKMLDYFGIENEVSQGKNFDDLLDCLKNGGRAIVALDSGEYWNSEGYWDDLFDPKNGADHAIEVIGFNPETNSVIVNDSGNPNGCGSEIPLDTFLDAWEDSGNFMIEVPGVHDSAAA